MQIKITSVIVDDQDKALKFYTEILGFVKKTEFKVVAPEGAQDIERALEPNLFDSNIPQPHAADLCGMRDLRCVRRYLR